MSDATATTPLRQDLVERLELASTATIATQLFKRGLRHMTIPAHPLNPERNRVVGRAFTMRFIPAREDLCTYESMTQPTDLQYQAFEQVPAGDVLVVDSRMDTIVASAGDILVRRLIQRNVGGIVTDGAFRDSRRISELDIPAFGRGSVASTRVASFYVADLQVPIGCGNVPVFPGDVLVGDEDGVVVIPSAMADEVADHAAAQEVLEDYITQRIESGEELQGLYPPNEVVRRDFELSQRSRSWKP